MSARGRLKPSATCRKSGQVLEVWGTDPGSKNDIPDFCKKGGNALLDTVEDPDGFTRYFIKKG